MAVEQQTSQLFDLPCKPKGRPKYEPLRYDIYSDIRIEIRDPSSQLVRRIYEIIKSI
jgi:hypothetical protein